MTGTLSLTWVSSREVRLLLGIHLAGTDSHSSLRTVEVPVKEYSALENNYRPPKRVSVACPHDMRLISHILFWKAFHQEGQAI